MDTRFWGPSGWVLLHLTAQAQYLTEDARKFWLLLPFVLPCKFCRASLSEYYKKYPVPYSRVSTVLDNNKGSDLPKWIWSIHNCVNAKLRSQGLSKQDDPPFEIVQERYAEMFKQGCTKTEFPGFIFLFCIVDNHPAYSESVPMPDIPENINMSSFEERNQYNLLTAKERLNILKEWFRSIPHALPYKEWRTSWFKHSKGMDKAFNNRRSILQWLWKIQCGMTTDLNWLAKDTYYGVCKKIREHRSGCGADKKAKTCRSNKTKKKKEK